MQIEVRSKFSTIDSTKDITAYRKTPNLEVSIQKKQDHKWRQEGDHLQELKKLLHWKVGVCMKFQ